MKIFHNDFNFTRHLLVCLNIFFILRCSLTLPDHLKTTDLKWLSVWCRAFRVNFGDMFFPEDLKLEETVEEDDDVEEPVPENAGIPEELPPPLVEPVQPINAHDPHHRDEDWKDDSDAYSLPEAESESKKIK